MDLIFYQHWLMEGSACILEIACIYKKWANKSITHHQAAPRAIIGFEIKRPGGRSLVYCLTFLDSMEKTDIIWNRRHLREKLDNVSSDKNYYECNKFSFYTRIAVSKYFSLIYMNVNIYYINKIESRFKSVPVNCFNCNHESYLIKTVWRKS